MKASGVPLFALAALAAWLTAEALSLRVPDAPPASAEECVADAARCPLPQIYWSAIDGSPFR